MKGEAEGGAAEEAKKTNSYLTALRVVSGKMAGWGAGGGGGGGARKFHLARQNAGAIFL